jgi:hypothetical protein
MENGGRVAVPMVCPWSPYRSVMTGSLRQRGRDTWNCVSISVLIATAVVNGGRGFVQARGGPLVRIRAGDVIVTPPGEWHWHGAAPNHFMAHFAFTEGETEWGEHLGADEYPSG